MHLINGDKVVGVTIVATAECARQDMGTAGAHAAALWNAHIITNHSISRHGDAGGAFAIVQKAVVGPDGWMRRWNGFA
jgi:hypothetical protein